ncbi:MAG: response regulator [Armatimonadia bacterium]|jgi:CheY-like chemotaxis protein|nr:response regulator [Armatimonadia bacterium]
MPDKKKVLLVDDDPDFIAINRIAVEAAGYTVVTASSRSTGLEAAKSENPDAIVLDVMMDTPTDGFELARELRADSSLKETPLIMLTAVNQEDIPFRFDKDESWLPVDTFLDKPVEPEKLVAEIQKALNA